MKHLLSRKDYISSLDCIENDINGYIYESMSVSMECDDVVNMIVNQINNLNRDIDNLDYKNPPNIGYDCEYFSYKENPIVNIWDKKCELNINFINIKDDISPVNLREICDEICLANIIRNISYNNVMSYILNATIVLNKMVSNKYLEVVLSHEIRHAFIYYKRFDGMLLSDIVKKTNSDNDWYKVYDTCRNFIKSSTVDNNFNGLGEDFYNIIFAIYCSDKEEIDAFTQEAYKDAKSCKSISDIKNTLKKTDLWDNLCNMKRSIYLLTNEYKEKYKEYRKNITTLKNLPSYKKMLSLMTKRYEKGYSNFGKLVMRLIDELEEEFVQEQIEKIGCCLRNEKDIDFRKYYI